VRSILTGPWSQADTVQYQFSTRSVRGAGAYISEIERRVLQGRVRKGLADDILVGRALSVQNGASIHDVLTVMPP
jgi:hypothetical protein